MAKLGNLASRLLVAAFALPILVYVIYLEQPAWLWGLVFAASLLAMYEFFSMTLPDRTDRLASLAAGAAVSGLLYWWQPWLQIRPENGSFLAVSGPTAVLALSVIPIALYYLFRFGDMETVGRRLAMSLTGIVYVGLLLTFLALVKRDFGPSGGHAVLFVLGIAWAGDTGAYFAGRFLGKSKLYPAVSPGKTWAGAFGGVAASVAIAAGLKLGLWPELGWVDVFALSIPGASLGQMGDLVESLLKRSCGVKDSGALLPGHGGILDRVDAVLFLAPYVYLYLTVRGQLA